MNGDIEVGDFVVLKGRWSVSVVQVARVTKKTGFYIETFRTLRGQCTGKENQFRLDDVLFAGLESTARRLLEQLTSSEAQLDLDTANARQRRHDRDHAFIERALAHTSTDKLGAA